MEFLIIKLPVYLLKWKIWLKLCPNLYQEMLLFRNFKLADKQFSPSYESVLLNLFLMFYDQIYS